MKVNLFDKKLTETAIKVEYRLSYFTFDVLYHLSLLFVNCFRNILDRILIWTLSTQILKYRANIWIVVGTSDAKINISDEKSAPTNQCAPPCVRKPHGQSCGEGFPRRWWTWCITSPSVRLICGRTHYPLDCLRLDRYNQPRRFLCVGTRTAHLSVKSERF